jgi:hypothetical protein
MNNTRKIPLKSSIFPENPYNATGLTNRTPTNQHKAAISSLSVNFGKISQNKLNFTAQTSLYPAQKISITTAVDRSLLDIQGGRDDA